MRTVDHLCCQDFPCLDTLRSSYYIPAVDVDPAKVTILLISEACPVKLSDHYYAGPEALFTRTTVLAFQDAGKEVETIQDVLDLGVYLTTAVKCGKTTAGIARATIEKCSHLLEKEIALFPNIRVFLLMGDVAIKAINTIAKHRGEPRVIPTGSTYKIRGGEFYFHGARAFPSYVQAGAAFFVEKSKRRMIAEDLHSALALVHRVQE